MIYRNILSQDYYNGYLELLQQLTVIEPNKISFTEFINFISNLNDNHQIIIFIDNNKIIACGTIFIEQKIIHNLGKVAHLEDIVVDTSMRGKNVGKYVLDTLKNIAIEKNCYKIILDCLDKNIIFYEKCGFIKSGNQMKIILQ